MLLSGIMGAYVLFYFIFTLLLEIWRCCVIVRSQAGLIGVYTLTDSETAQSGQIECIGTYWDFLCFIIITEAILCNILEHLNCPLHLSCSDEGFSVQIIKEVS